ncbi:hypothetical protein ND16A_0312 [Thalassotalea sp. ND16A]|nr:hypothetical protein ND16A_0312 [Thalassotalea sp. ND16A]
MMTPQSSNVQVMSYSPVYPILIGKEHNPALRVNIVSKQRHSDSLRNITLDFSGSDDVSAIKTAKLFYSGGGESFTATNLVGSTDKISALTTIKLSKPVVPSQGNNYFWLTVSVRNDANTLHDVTVNASQIKLGNETLAVTALNETAHNRIGHALRQAKDDGVNTYRIPGLETTNKGTLLAIYDVRHDSSVDLQGDIDVGMSRSTDGGQTWQPMKIIMDMGEWGGLPQDQNGVGDPSILVDRLTNTIWVAALWAHGHPGKRSWYGSKQGMTPVETGQLILTKSEDDGLTWSAPINITKQVKDPQWRLLLDGPGKGISLNDGTLVFPVQYKDENKLAHSTLISSKDHGKTWTIGTSAKTDTTEAQVVQLSDGSLMLNMRDNRGQRHWQKNGTGARALATTSDLGQTWQIHPTSNKALPEPVCSASLISHQMHSQPSLLLFSNPASQYSRRNMTIKVSQDDGMSWPVEHFTLIDEGLGYGYSSLTSINEQIIGILYESSQSHMTFQRFKLSELMKHK